MSSHDPITPHNFTIQVEGHEGDFVRLRVRVEQTVPAGGITLSVLWDPAAGQPVSVSPWRNLGRFVTEAIAHEVGGAGGH